MTKPKNTGMRIQSPKRRLPNKPELLTRVMNSIRQSCTASEADFEAIERTLTAELVAFDERLEKLRKRNVYLESKSKTPRKSRQQRL